MPSWVKDHEVWEKAKARVREQYPDLSEDDERFYALATAIYKKMGGAIGTAKCLLVFGKAHVKGHYRTDPRTGRQVYVQPYDDKRPTASGEQPASQPAPATPEVPTVKLNNGREVAAKFNEGELVALTYANRTQAERKREQLGDGWEVVGGTGLIRPFYVAKVPAERAKETAPREAALSGLSDDELRRMQETGGRHERELARAALEQRRQRAAGQDPEASTMAPADLPPDVRDQIARDAPLNPKVAPLVYALNRAGIKTTLSGDAYGDELVYVDVAPEAAERLDPDKLPSGWKLVPVDTAHMNEQVLGLPLSDAQQRQAEYLRRVGAFPDRRRLARAEKHGVTQDEAAQIVQAFSRQPEKKEPWQMTRREWIERARHAFVRRDGERRLWLQWGDALYTIKDQKNGKLTRHVDDILADLHEWLVRGAADLRRRDRIDAEHAEYPAQREDARRRLERPEQFYPPAEVMADYPDLQPQRETPPPAAASQLPIQVEHRTGQEGSVYEGDDLAALLRATKKEQRGRFRTIQTLRGTLALGTHPTTGRPLTPKQREELEKELANLEKEYAGVYEQVEQAAGDQDAQHLREQVEQPANSGRSFSIERQDPSTGQLKTQTFRVGDYVEVWLGEGRTVHGTITGISHARREAKVDGTWMEFGRIYPASQTPLSRKKQPTVPLSRSIREAEKTPPGGWKGGDQLSLFKRIERGVRLFFGKTLTTMQPVPVKGHTRTVGGKQVVVAPHVARHAKRADWTKPIGTSRDVSLEELNTAIRRGDQVCQEDCAGQAARLEILLQPHVYKVWQKLNTKDAGAGYRAFPRVRRATNAKYGDGYVFEWVRQEPGGQETVIPWNAVRDDYFSHQPGTAWNGVSRETLHRFVDDLYMIARGYVSDEIVDSEFMRRAARAGLRVLVRRDLPAGFAVGERLERPSGERVTVIGGRQDLGDPTHYLLVQDEQGQVSDLSPDAVTSGRVQRLQKALGRAWQLLFGKAHVRSYQRTTASGQVVTVREHDDKRRAAHEDPAAGRRPRQEEPASGRQDPRRPVQPTQRTALGTPFNAVEPPEPGRLAEWLHLVNREPDIQQAMREVLEGTSTRQLYRQADGSYTPERAQLHESIVASMLNPRAVAQEGQRPQVCILLGAPASGKTTALQPAAREIGVEFTVINADDVKEKLPEYNGRNAGLVHEESSDIAEGRLLPRALQARHHLCLDITGANGKKVLAMVEEFHKAGYDISVMYVHLPLEKAAARAVGRFRESGRFVPPDYVVHKVDGGPEQTYNALKNDPRVSHWRRYSTDVERGAQPVRQEIGRRDAGARDVGRPVAKSIARDSSLAGLRGDGGVPERHHSPEPPDLQQHAPSVTALLEQAAASLRDHAQADIMALEEQGITSQDRQERYRQALDGRRRCDLVSRMIEDPTHEEAL